MPVVKTVKKTGRIIRILDKRTVIINLGKEDGITEASIFSTLGKPESVIDPFSNQELGQIRVVKAKVKAAQVYEKFTIATSKWTETRVTSQTSAMSAAIAMLGTTTQTIDIDEGELRVNNDEVQDWKAKSEELIRVGDEVEVMVRISEPDPKNTP